MGKALLKVIFKLMKKLIGLFLTPINLLVANYIPTLQSGINAIVNFFHTLVEYTPLVCSYTGITVGTFAIINDLIVANILISFLVHSLKLIIKWYNALKP